MLDKTAVIAATAAIIGVIIGFLGHFRLVKSDSYVAGTEKGNLQADIAYIKKRTDDVLLEQKDTNRSISALTERVTRVEESAKSAHKRIDEIIQLENEGGKKIVSNHK